jgi:RNA polymerase sigma-70 factor, ECF subfamily
MTGERIDTFNEHRPYLFSIAYRMLGTVADAEDMLQEAFLRWERAGTDEIRSPRAFLATITTRLCLNHLESARVRREEYVGPWLPEPLVTDEREPVDRVELAESLSIAFLVLLETLSPAERAVLLLRDVFGYEYSEIATILGTSEANCRQALSRARKHVSENRPRFETSPEQHDALLRGFLKAAADGDLAGLVAILAEDVTLRSDGGGKATAALNPIEGADKVARFFVGVIKKFGATYGDFRFAEINGQPGVIAYVDGEPASVLTFEFSNGRIRNVFIVRNPDKLRAMPR